MPSEEVFVQEIGDLPDRVVAANDRSVLKERGYILVVLNRALRGEDNPTIDAALCHAEALDLPVVVYSELDEQVAWASDRLFYFALGAFRECAIALQKRQIPCVQTIKQKDTHMLEDLISKAAVVYTDEDHTHWDLID